MTGRPRGRRPRRPVPPSKGAGRPCIRRTGSSRPTDGCDDCPGISAAQHRRRPGGPSRYSAATFRACRVTPTRATRGAAAPVTKHKKEPGVDARPVLVLSVQLSAAMNPRIGGSRVGEATRPFFPPISLGRNGGARRAGTRREAGLHQTGGYYPPLRAWQLAYRAGQARPQGTRPFQDKKRAARDTGGACVYRSSRKYAKPRLAGGCLSRLLRREVKISTTTVTT